MIHPEIQILNVEAVVARENLASSSIRRSGCELNISEREAFLSYLYDTRK